MKGNWKAGITSGELKTEAAAVPTARVAIRERSTPLEITTTAIPILRIPKMETDLIRVSKLPVVKKLFKKTENKKKIVTVTTSIINSWFLNFKKVIIRYWHS